MKKHPNLLLTLGFYLCLLSSCYVGDEQGNCDEVLPRVGDGVYKGNMSSLDFQLDSNRLVVMGLHLLQATDLVLSTGEMGHTVTLVKLPGRQGWSLQSGFEISDQRDLMYRFPDGHYLRIISAEFYGLRSNNGMPRVLCLNEAK